eukprot:TRINITY_DN4575_c0_g1_i1.p1 TRINITY_DN4575_c0_g1~~TRINITY_DN4575_c0_g1_i1.p1  ORF type:complete len:257 (-),score=51.65 TRINITY_DN4575_c0_g1_i1:1019-1789(-)
MSKNYQVIRYRDGKNTFEVLTKTGLALKFREGNIGSVANVLYADEIFSNQSKGERANASDLERAFNSSDINTCAKIIIEKGDFHMSTSERKEKVEKKRAEMVNYIHKYYIDPRSKTPHPVARIEEALNKMKLNIDINESAERQVKEKVIKKLPEIIPISRTEMAGTLIVPHAAMGSATGIIHQYVSVDKEDWTSTGCTMQISLVPGDYDKFMSEMQNVTKGDFTFNIFGKTGTTPSPAEGKKGKRGKGGRKKRGRK